MMNEQEFFDTTVIALRAQGGPSINEKGVCLYRGPNGRKCAAGIHITDEEYDPRMDPQKLHTLLAERAVGGKWAWLSSDHVLRLHWRLAGQLQGAHDKAARAIKPEENMAIREGAEFFEVLEPELRSIARDYGLTYTEPK